jgi:hypothetical protein
VGVTQAPEGVSAVACCRLDLVARHLANGPLPDFRTISGLQQALTMLGYHIAVDGDHGAETRQVVTSFQMRTGFVADGVAGAQREAKLLGELNRVRETNGHLPR